MKTTHAERCRRSAGRILAPAAALLLSMLAVPADAQRGGARGGHGSGHHGHYGSHSGHRGGGSLHHGSHRYRGQGHSAGYRHGYRGDHRHYDSGRGHRFYGYRGAYGYPSYYGGVSHASYVYYGRYGSYGSGHYGYPGVSIRYQSRPWYVIGGVDYSAIRPVAEDGAPGLDVVPEGGEPYSGEPYTAAEAFDARPQPARVKLAITPGDASVYLDGRFLGLASELPAELWLDPGAHRLEVARPGFSSRQLDLELEAGEELDVDARLDTGARVPDRRR